MRLPILTLIALITAASATAGTAKDFSVKDIDGKQHSLSQYKGKIVVLEWFRHGCPFVQKHYKDGHMQKLQATLTQKGVVWLSVCSSGPGKTGHLSKEDHSKEAKSRQMSSTAIIQDEDGTLGKLYGAKVTPHLFVIDAKGDLVYQGAIDNKKSTRSADIEGAENFVKNAVQELLDGKKVSVPQTAPYGCGIKY